MIFLIDYDNVRPLERSRGVTYVVEKTIRAVGVAPFRGNAWARVRLYGGWFRHSRHSRLAQTLASEIAVSFPRPVVVTDATGHLTVMARAELAYALECDPRNPFPNTYRLRSAPANLRAKSLPYMGCGSPGACPLGAVHVLLGTGRCPQQGCSASLDAIVERAEQKLVDGMLTADIIHLSTRTREPIAVVSSDDDLWPALHGAVVYGADVHHVHTHSGRTTPTHYSGLITGKYSQCSL